eukprot:7035753-Karenia_brevis.AAC.1
MQDHNLREGWVVAACGANACAYGELMSLLNGIRAFCTTELLTQVALFWSQGQLSSPPDDDDDVDEHVNSLPPMSILSHRVTSLPPMMMIM